MDIKFPLTAGFLILPFASPDG